MYKNLSYCKPSSDIADALGMPCGGYYLTIETTESRDTATTDWSKPDWGDIESLDGLLKKWPAITVVDTLPQQRQAIKFCIEELPEMPFAAYSIAGVHDCGNRLLDRRDTLQLQYQEDWEALEDSIGTSEEAVCRENFSTTVAELRECERLLEYGMGDRCQEDWLRAAQEFLRLREKLV